MAERIHLDVVERDDEKIWFTLVVDDPVGFYVEQYHEPNGVCFSARTRNIQPDELAKTWINDLSLIKLVENKFQEMAEAALTESRAA